MTYNDNSGVDYATRNIGLSGVAPLSSSTNTLNMNIWQNGASGRRFVGDIVTEDTDLNKNIGSLQNTTSEEYMNRLDRAQSVGQKLGYGAVQMLGTAAMTVVSNIFGLPIGIAESIKDGNIARMWDNSMTLYGNLVLQSLHDNLPIFRGSDYENQTALQRLGSSNFWADNISSAGFTVGTIISGLLTGGLGAELGMSKFAAGATASLLAAYGEAAMEAENHKSEAENEIKDLEDKLRISSTLNDWKDNVDYQKQKDFINLYLGLIPDVEMQGYHNEIDRLYAELVKQRKEDQAAQQKEIDEKKQRDLITAGNLVFGANMALLTISNALEFGDLFAHGFGKNAIINAMVKENAAGKMEGITAKELYGRLAGKQVINSASEAVEEFSQNVVQTTAKKFTDVNSEYFFDAANDEGGAAMLSKLGSSLLASIAESFNDENAKTEALSGAVTGLLFGLGSAAMQREFSSARKTVEQSKTFADALNEWMEKMPETAAYRKGIIRKIALTGLQNQFIEDGNVKSFKDAESAKFLSDLMMWYSVGKSDKVKQMMVDTVDEMSDEDIQQIIDQTTIGNSGPYVTNGNKKSVKEVRKDLKETFANNNKVIQQYEKAYDKYVKKYGNINPDTMELLLFYNLQIQNSTDRKNQIVDDLYSKLILARANDALYYSADMFREVSSKADLVEALKKPSKVKALIDLLSQSGIITPEEVDEFTQRATDVKELDKSATQLKARLDKLTKELDFSGKWFAERRLNTFREQEKKEKLNKLNAVHTLEDLWNLADEEDFAWLQDEMQNSDSQIVKDFDKIESALESVEEVAKDMHLTPNESKWISDALDKIMAKATSYNDIFDTKAVDIVNNLELKDMFSENHTPEQTLNILLFVGNRIEKLLTTLKNNQTEREAKTAKPENPANIPTAGPTTGNDSVEGTPSVQTSTIKTTAENYSSHIIQRANLAIPDFNEQDIKAPLARFVDTLEKYLKTKTAQDKKALQLAYQQLKDTLERINDLIGEFDTLKEEVEKDDYEFVVQMNLLLYDSDYIETIQNNTPSIDDTRAQHMAEKEIERAEKADDDSNKNGLPKSPLQLKYYRPNLSLHALSNADEETYLNEHKAMLDALAFAGVFDRLNKGVQKGTKLKVKTLSSLNVSEAIKLKFNDLQGVNNIETSELFFMVIEDEVTEGENKFDLIVGILPKDSSKYTGLAELKQAVKEGKTTIGKNNRPIELTVAKTMLGLFAHSQDISLNYKFGDDPNFLIGIIAKELLEVPNAPANVTIKQAALEGNRIGRAYTMLKNSRGELQPFPLYIKHLNNNEFNLAEEVNKGNLIAIKLKKAIEALMSAKTVIDSNNATIALRQILVLPSQFDVIIRNTPLINGEEIVGYSYFIELKKTNGEVSIFSKQRILLYDKLDNESENRNVNTNAFQEIYDALVNLNMPFAVNLDEINKGDHNKMLVDSGILQSSLQSTTMENSWFITDFYNPTTEEFEDAVNLQGKLLEASKPIPITTVRYNGRQYKVADDLSLVYDSTGKQAENFEDLPNDVKAFIKDSLDIFRAKALKNDKQNPNPLAWNALIDSYKKENGSLYALKPNGNKYYEEAYPGQANTVRYIDLQQGKYITKELYATGYTKGESAPAPVRTAPTTKTAPLNGETIKSIFDTLNKKSPSTLVQAKHIHELDKTSYMSDIFAVPNIVDYFNGNEELSDDNPIQGLTSEQWQTLKNRLKIFKENYLLNTEVVAFHLVVEVTKEIENQQNHKITKVLKQTLVHLIVRDKSTGQLTMFKFYPKLTSPNIKTVFAGLNANEVNSTAVNHINIDANILETALDLDLGLKLVVYSSDELFLSLLKEEAADKASSITDIDRNPDAFLFTRKVSKKVSEAKALTELLQVGPAPKASEPKPATPKVEKAAELSEVPSTPILTITPESFGLLAEELPDWKKLTKLQQQKIVDNTNINGELTYEDMKNDPLVAEQIRKCIL